MNIPIYTNWRKGRQHSAAEKLASKKRLEWSNAFVFCFKFHPDNLSDPVNQHEVYIKLGFLALAVTKRAEALGKDSTSQCQMEYYELSLSKFVKAVNCLKYFSPELAAKLPHWTNFPSFLDDLLGGNPEKVFTPIIPPEAAPEPLPPAPYQNGDWCKDEEHIN